MGSVWFRSTSTHSSEPIIHPKELWEDPCHLAASILFSYRYGMIIAHYSYLVNRIIGFYIPNVIAKNYDDFMQSAHIAVLMLSLYILYTVQPALRVTMQISVLTGQ